MERVALMEAAPWSTGKLLWLIGGFAIGMLIIVADWCVRYGSARFHDPELAEMRRRKEEIRNLEQMLRRPDE